MSNILKNIFLCSAACFFILSPSFVGVQVLHLLQHICGGNATDKTLLNMSNWFIRFCGFAVSTRYPQPSRFCVLCKTVLPTQRGDSFGEVKSQMGDMLPRWTLNLRVCVLNRSHYLQSNVHTARACRQSAVTLGYCDKRRIES